MTSAKGRLGSRIATPDALQLTAALTARCSAFVTNDRQLPSGPAMKVLQLSSYSR
jgi:predicted nucleic acid-binding protein